MNADRAAPVRLAGRFELGERVGSGGMAEVYRATDIELDRDVAVKLVDLNTDIDGQARSRVGGEARRAAKLRHPNVVQVHDVGSDEVHAYIVMEHIDGPTLADVLDRRGPLPEHEVAKFGVQICDALGAAHDAGVIHRDVKPGNILIDDGRVKVTDFGIARVIDDTLPGETVEGTIGYLAPEQVSGGEVDHRVDLYALGIVLYELATGRRPFEGATAAETAFQRLHADPPPPSRHADVSPAFDQAIGRALARGLDDRFQTAAELRGALQPLAVDPTVDTQPLAGALASDIGTTPPTGDRNRQRWWLAGGLLSVLLLAASALLFAPQLLDASVSEVPDVSGSTIRAAAALLDQHGLEVGQVTRRISDRPAGTVIDQDPPAGVDAPADGTVDLVVAYSAPSSSPSPSPDGTPAPAGRTDEPAAVESEVPDPTGDEQPEQQQPGGGAPEGRGPDGQGPPGQDDDPPGRD